MMTCGEGSVTPSVVLSEILPVLSEAAANRLSFQELPIDTQRALGHFGIYGSDSRNAFSAKTPWRTHRTDQGLDRMLDRGVSNSDEALAEVEEYGEARKEGTSGLTQALAWTAIRGSRASGVFIDFPQRNRAGEVVDGVVTSYVSTFTFATKAFSTLFHTLIQATYHRSPNKHIVRPTDASPDWVDPENPWDTAWIPPERKFELKADGTVILEVKPIEPAPPKPRPHTVEVSMVNEYISRITHEIRAHQIRQELARMPIGYDERGNARIGITLPRDKVPLKDWKEKTTLHPEIEELLDLINQTYDRRHRSGFVVADYVETFPDGTPFTPTRRENITATDTSAADKIKRDESNGRGHFLKERGGDVHEKIEGDSRFHQDQHGNRGQRLWIERGVYIYRPRLPKGVKYYSPSQARPLNVFQRAIIEIKETWIEVKQNPARLAEKLPDLAAPVFGGLLDLATVASKLAIRGAVASWKGVKNYGADIISFRKQKKQARARVGEIHAQLQKMQDDILAGAPDVFPDTSLPDSPQLRVIKQMSAMMREQLTYAE